MLGQRPRGQAVVWLLLAVFLAIVSCSWLLLTIIIGYCWLLWLLLAVVGHCWWQFVKQSCAKKKQQQEETRYPDREDQTGSKELDTLNRQAVVYPVLTHDFNDFINLIQGSPLYPFFSPTQYWGFKRWKKRGGERWKKKRTLKVDKDQLQCYGRSLGKGRVQ